MKKLLLIIICSVFTSLPSFSQIFSGFSNDFEDGTTQGWSNGNNSPNPPTNVSSGGPSGANDNYLEEISAGGTGPGSKLVIFNTDPSWLGDYRAEAIQFIGFDARVISNEDLKLRIAMQGGLNNSQMVSTNPVTIPIMSGWNNFSIPIDSSDFTVLSGGETALQILSNVGEIRILHNPIPEFNGATIDATLHIDNVIADGTIIGFDDINRNEIKIFPNPAANNIHIESNSGLSDIKIFDVLGKLVISKILNDTKTSVDISDLKNGIYIAKIENKSGSISRKIIKL